MLPDTDLSLKYPRQFNWTYQPKASQLPLQKRPPYVTTLLNSSHGEVSKCVRLRPLTSLLSLPAQIWVLWSGTVQRLTFRALAIIQVQRNATLPTVRDNLLGWYRSDRLL